MNAAEAYKAERERRGTQEAVAALLGVMVDKPRALVTIAQ